MKDLHLETVPSRHDKHRIDIAVGGVHRGKVTNKSVSLAKFRETLSAPSVDNSITFAQYQDLSPNDKAERKMMAGYIMPGHFREGIRKITHQMFRSVIALDLDYVTPEQLDLIRECLVPLRRYYWFMHTTRSHCPERPRVRLYIPLSRNVDADEAFGITRLAALLLADDPDEAIEIPDLVSFRYNQIMYRPSISRGQEFWTDENAEADILDVDEFLAGHPTWKDISTLPKQEKEKDLRKTDTDARMEDPREKAGLLGAFCRTYDVREAIAEFLPDIYVPGVSATEERYSYALGTTFNGAVVYDDGLFLHSHHGSDPADGMHNAWDLVRIHKFGHLDKDVREGTSPGDWPSFKAMREFAQKDPRVAAERFSGMDFDDTDDEEEDDFDPTESGSDDEADEAEDQSPEFDDDDLEDLIGELPKKAEKPAKKEKAASDDDWRGRFRVKANGQLEPVLHNITLICENDRRIARCIAFNDLTLNPAATRQMTSKKFTLASPPLEPGEKFREWEEGDDTSILRICSAPVEQGGYGFDPPASAVQNAVVLAGRQRAFHPIRDRILAFHAQWLAAGRPTGLIDTLPQRYLGCPDDAFHRESSRTLMVALCARTFRPGVKFDIVTIIRGEQGGRKSSFWRALAIQDEFFNELPNNFDKVDRMIEAMRGRLILEMPEMASLRKETAEIAKAFISAQQDQHRLAYAKRAGVYRRQSCLVGTSNLDAILHDPTGNRRFWIWVDVHSEKQGFFIDIDALRAELPMLYGEAYQAYLDRCAQTRGRDDLWLDLQTPEARAGRDKLAEQYREKTAVEIIAEAIQDWVDQPLSAREIEVPGVDKFDADGPEPKYVRNAITAKEAFLALSGDPLLGIYRNADVRTFGKALGYLKGWECPGYVHRFGIKAPWYFRKGQPPDQFIPMSEEPDYDDLI